MVTRGEKNGLPTGLDRPRRLRRLAREKLIQHRPQVPRLEPGAGLILKELPVRIGHIDETPGIAERGVGCQRRVAAARMPAFEGFRALTRLQHHDLVVAAQRH